MITDTQTTGQVVMTELMRHLNCANLNELCSRYNLNYSLMYDIYIGRIKRISQRTAKVITDEIPNISTQFLTAGVGSIVVNQEPTKSSTNAIGDLIQELNERNNEAVQLLASISLRERKLFEKEKEIVEREIRVFERERTLGLR